MQESMSLKYEPSSKPQVLGMLLNIERRPEWDDLCDHGYFVPTQFQGVT